MLIKSAIIRWISDEKGYGLFAKEFIPKGTITFVNDNLDLVIDPKDKRFHKEPYKTILEKYAYNSSDSKLILCWDFGKYMNHCCYSNTLSTGYEFDVAVTDIHPGEEITTDYGGISTGHYMVFSCDKANCRKSISGDNFDKLVDTWDVKIKEALQSSRAVSQPLWDLIPKKTLTQLNKFLEGDAKKYVSLKKQQPK
ncbi:MAG: SET domain-containing protein [Bacteriovoracaceae bacterium]|nr:SET domain-containing protein [Bacteriovoracaceae bacterium]